MAEFQYLNQGNTEVQDKQAEAYLFAPSGTTGIAATGVIEGLVVAQTATASGSVLIDAGAGLNQASLGQGADRLINPSQKTLDIFTANPMGGLPRNDIVAFDSITTAIIAIIGTPNATPTDPTVPATSVALGRLRHAASATTIPTAKIDDLRVFTTLRGTPIPVNSQAQRDALTPFDGLQVYRLDLHFVETYNGAAWLQDGGLETFAGSGGAIAGAAYTTAKPVRHHYIRGTVASDPSSGVINVATPSGCTSVLMVMPVVEIGPAACTLVVRPTGTTIASVQLQARNTTGTGNSLPSTTVQFAVEIVYQI